MKKIFLLSLLLIFTMLSACEKNNSEQKNLWKNSEKIENFILKPEIFSEKMELTWTLQANKEVPIATKQAWRISDLFFDVWDFVFQNTLLWKLAWDESKVNLQTANSNVSNLRNLFSAQTNLLDEQVKNAQKAVELAKENLKAISIQKDASVLTIDEQKKFYETKVKEAETALENIKISNTQNLETLYKNAISQIRNWYMIASSSVNFLDDLLWITDENEHKNDSFEWNLWTLNTATKSKSQHSARKIIAEFNEFQAFYDEKIDWKSPSREILDEWLEKNLKLLENLQTALKDSYEMLDNSTSWANFTEANLQNYKNQNLTFWWKVESAINSWNWWVKYIKIQIENAKTQWENNLKSAQTALNSAKQALSQISASTSQNFSNTTSQKEIAQKQVEQAEISLKTAIANKNSALKDLKSKIDLASWNARLSQVAVWNTQIWAPFNWIITEKIWEVWQVVWAGQPIYKIADISKYKIISDISDTKIWKLKIWQKIEFSVDWLLWKFSWKLTKIYPKVDETSRKIKLEFEVDEKNNQFKIGSFSRIKIFFEDKNAFFVPKKFLNFDENWAFIILKNWEKKYVKLWAERKNWDEQKIWFPWEMEWKIILQKQ